MRTIRGNIKLIVFCNGIDEWFWEWNSGRVERVIGFGDRRRDPGGNFELKRKGDGRRKRAGHRSNWSFF